MKFQVPAILNSVSFTKDNGLRLGFLTQELANDEKAYVQQYYQKFGHLLFQPNEFQTSDIPKENIEDKTKTPSKRLRAVIYIYWQQTKSNEDFEIFYRQKMEKLIDFIKEKLD